MYSDENYRNMLKKRQTHLDDSIEWLQQANNIGRTTAPNAIDVNTTFIKTVGHRESIVIVDFVLIQGNME